MSFEIRWVKYWFRCLCVFKEVFGFRKEKVVVFNFESFLKNY